MVRAGAKARASVNVKLGLGLELGLGLGLGLGLMKPSGPGLLFAGRFLITVWISLLVMGLLRRPSFKVCNKGFPGRSDGKESTCKCRRHEFNPCIGKIPPGIPWRKCQPTPILLPEEFHGQRKLAGYSPCGHKKLDTTD